jgi:cytoskeletal protein CcmA (bactofilin family)
MLKIIVLAVLAIVPLQFAAAETIVRTGDAVSLAQNQTVEGDFYGLGSTVALSGTVTGDAHVAGGTVTVNGPINQDVFIVGGTVNLGSTVGDDVRIIAGDVTISQPVTGSLFVIGGRLNVLSTATVGGDILFYGGEATIEGEVGGQLLGNAERIRVDGTVKGGVNVTAPFLSLGDRANITGDVQYVSRNELTRGTGAVVSGSVVRNDVVEETTTATELRAPLIMFLVSLFATLTLYLLFRVRVEALGAAAVSRFGFKALIGFATFVAMPIAVLVLLLSMLGTIVGLIGLATFMLLILVALALMSVVAGSFVMLLITKKAEVTVLSILAGAAAVNAFLFIPVIGPVVVLLLFFITLGTIVLRGYHAIR